MRRTHGVQSRASFFIFIRYAWYASHSACGAGRSRAFRICSTMPRKTRTSPPISPPTARRRDHSKQTTKGIGLRCGFKLFPESGPLGDVIWTCMHSTCVCGSFFFGDSLQVLVLAAVVYVRMGMVARPGVPGPSPASPRARVAARMQ